MKKFIILGFLAGALCLPMTAQATTDTQSLIESLRQQIEQLQAEILELQNQLTIVKEAKQEIKETSQGIFSTLRIMRQLDIGISGEDVTLLQEVLATDPEIYPEGLATGYFGPLTFRAVQRFQERMGVEQAGRVGPKTMAKINELLEEGAGSSGKVPPGLLIAPGIQKKLGYAPEAPVGQQLPPGISKKLGEDDATTTPDVTEPIISTITATNTAATSTNIVWTTDEDADSVVWYDTVDPLVISTSTLNIESATLTLSHDLLVEDLTASTTYYYMVTSADEAGNRATSSQESFTTLEE